MLSPVKRRTTAEDVRRVALAALATALDDGKQEARKKPGLTGMRAVATGAVLYTAGRAVFTGRRFVRDHFGADGERAEADEDFDDEDDEPEAEADEDFDDEDDEPEAEADEDFDDEDEPDDDEPEADADEDFDDDDEPEADADEDFDDDDEPDDDEDEPDDEPEADVPRRPSRSRAPLARG